MDTFDGMSGPRAGRARVGVRSGCSEQGGQRADSRRGGQLGIKARPVVGRTKAETARKLADNDMWGGREGRRAAQPLQPTRL